MIYAGFWRRLGGILIDGLLLGGLGFPWIHFDSRSVAVIYMFLASILGWIYQIYFHARWGQTIGKMAMGIKVVSLDASPITLRQAVLRSSVDIVLSTIFCIS